MKTYKIEIDFQAATEADAQLVANSLPVIVKNISPKDLNLLKRVVLEKANTFKMALSHLRNLF